MGEEMATLREKLEKQLPAKAIEVVGVPREDGQKHYHEVMEEKWEEGWIRYYDWHGVTCHISTDEEFAIVNQYIEEVVEQRIGEPVKIVKTMGLGNGHFALQFKKKTGANKDPEPLADRKEQTSA